jgi:hypothetical protein
VTARLLTERTRAVSSGVLAGCVAFLLSGCGEERDYAVPAKVCGARVEPDLLEPLLPPGDKLTATKDDFGGNRGLEGCTVHVDGRVVLSTQGEWRAERLSAEEAATNPSPEPFAGGRFASWDRGAATVLACHAPARDVVSADEGEGQARYMTLVVDVPVPDEGTEDAMKKFIVEYARAYAETLPCQK